MGTIKSAVMHEPGRPEVLKIESRPIPVPQAGEVLIRIKGVRAEPLGAVHRSRKIRTAFAQRAAIRRAPARRTA